MSVGTTGVGAAENAYAAYQAPTEKKENTKKVDETKTQEAAVYEKSSTEKKASYSINKMSKEQRAAMVSQMKQDQVNRQQQLADIVQQMLSKQAGASNLASMFSPENLKNVDAAAIEQAKKDISEDGYWGVKQTAQRMFDFASALAGDDVEKMKEMQAAMEKGFREATRAWGTDLPSISQDTMKAANQMFEDYYASKQ